MISRDNDITKLSRWTIAPRVKLWQRRDRVLERPACGYELRFPSDEPRAARLARALAIGNMLLLSQVLPGHPLATQRGAVAPNRRRPQALELYHGARRVVEVHGI